MGPWGALTLKYTATESSASQAAHKTSMNFLRPALARQPARAREQPVFVLYLRRWRSPVRLRRVWPRSVCWMLAT